MTDLFTPLQMGALSLANRILMAPLTRARAGESRMPNDLMAQYYAQRASAGLIVGEATAISAEAYGWRGAPGLYEGAHVEGWRVVTDAVHRAGDGAGGKIVCQLWHMGRVSHPLLQPGGLPPFAPSAIAVDGENRSVRAPYVTPRAMSGADIARTINDYADAAARAIDAGFDGVEIHGANGYLISQFLFEGSNVRDDEYGGSRAKRARFLRDVVEAVGARIGFDRTGLRLSPINGYNGMHDSDLPGLFTYLAEMLNDYDLAFLHVREPSRDENGSFVPPPVTEMMRGLYRNHLVVNDGYDFESATFMVDRGLADAVAFGTPYIANPDLVERFKARAPLATARADTIYAGGAEGYSDYKRFDGEDA